ncbi:MAG: M48 family metallopeptidase [Flavobacteriaceae bacterium]|nr:M48 family metallopeptidase [Flavobacteriaceae bacterium]
MTPKILFYLLVAIIIIDYLLGTYMSYLNAKHFNDPIPKGLEDVYSEEEYQKSQRYKSVNSRFSAIKGAFSLVLTLLFFAFDGFAWLDGFVRTFSDNSIVITLLFFGILIFANDLISLPFSYYDTFVIEEKFGFNKTTKATFLMDKLKGWLLLILFGGGILATIVWLYELTTTYFWLYAWGLISLVSVFMNLFYTKLIVPLFNKQTPLQDGELKTAIENYANKVGFQLTKIFIIDGSKRSTKANAYFSGFGSQKQITLYDTLVNDLTTEEIVAVLAHEVGHYKKKHIIYNMVLSILLTGITFYILSLLVGSPLLSEALGVYQTPYFHIGLIVFSILYSPISELTSYLMNVLSRKFEYQADDYAGTTYEAKFLQSALKKLTKKSLSNLTPHKFYVKMYYSHPTLQQRIINLQKFNR